MVLTNNASLSRWGIKEYHLDDILSKSFTKGRMDNNIINLTQYDIMNILKIHSSSIDVKK